MRLFAHTKHENLLSFFHILFHFVPELIVGGVLIYIVVELLWKTTLLHIFKLVNPMKIGFPRFYQILEPTKLHIFKNLVFLTHYLPLFIGIFARCIIAFFGKYPQAKPITIQEVKRQKIVFGNPRIQGTKMQLNDSSRFSWHN